MMEAGIEFVTIRSEEEIKLTCPVGRNCTLRPREGHIGFAHVCLAVGDGNSVIVQIEFSDSATRYDELRITWAGDIPAVRARLKRQSTNTLPAFERSRTEFSYELMAVPGAYPQ